MNNTLLWLDDVRDPTKNLHQTAGFAAKGIDKVHWVKNYAEFVAWIEQHGLPAGVSFDHDLADQHYEFPEATDMGHFTEKTGYDCAFWLVVKCMGMEAQLPYWGCHSANPWGRARIESLLSDYDKEWKSK